jgi:hypothetical protein
MQGIVEPALHVAVWSFLTSVSTSAFTSAHGVEEEQRWG